MEGVTLAIALFVSAAVFCLRPIYGLIIYVAVLAWYPAYLTVPVGTVDFTVCRIVILAIYVSLLLKTNLLSKFRFVWLDRLVIIYFLCQLLAMSVTTPMSQFFENRAGSLFDTMLPYFAVRMIINTREQYVALLKGILIVAAPLAVVGFYQCITGHNPVGFLRKYHAWKNAGDILYSRYGFFRAEVTFPMSIMYGLFFAMFGPLCAGLLCSVTKHKTLYWIGLGLMALGIFSSMSSGPMLAGLLSVLFIVFYRWHRHWKLITIIIIITFGFVEIASNRHFYDVLGKFTLSPHTAYYRSRLISVALFEGGMSRHWIVGYGFSDPGWGPRVTGYSYTDIVNHYLAVLCSFGLVGFIPFMGVIAVALKNIVAAYKTSIYEADRWLVWCLSATFFGLLAALVSVSLFGQPKTVFYILLGFCGTIPTLVVKANKPAFERTTTRLLHTETLV